MLWVTDRTEMSLTVVFTKRFAFAFPARPTYLIVFTDASTAAFFAYIAKTFVLANLIAATFSAFITLFVMFTKASATNP
jgi:hypothetical protein